MWEIGDVNIGAFAYRLFKAVGQIADCTRHSLTGYGQHWTKPRLCYNDVYVLGLESAEDRGFGACSLRRVVDHANILPCSCKAEGWSGVNLCRRETAFQDETTGYVFVERPNVQLALRLSLEFCKVPKCMKPVVTQPGRTRLTAHGHNVSSYAVC